MTSDPLDRLRALDPAPQGSSAPPVQRVLALIDAEAARPASAARTRRGWRAVPRLIVPVLAVAATAAVVFVALAGHGGSTHRAPATTPAPTGPPPSPESLMPATGGMRGLVFNLDFAASGQTLVAAFAQCPACRSASTARAAQSYWTVSSRDRGADWRARRVSWTPLETMDSYLAASGRDVWAFAVRHGAIEFLASHDGGVRYGAVASAAAPSSFGGVVISDGRVWSIGTVCGGGSCSDRVMTGPAGGDRLVATRTQPPLRGATNVTVSAHGEDVAVTSGRALFETDNDGRSWTRVDYPCPSGRAGTAQAAGGQALWAACQSAVGRGGTNTVILRRSVDGGRRWRTVGPGLGPGLQTHVTAISSDVAWVLTTNGTLWRIADGGRSGVRVLHALGPRSAMTAETATAATVITAVTRGSGAARRTDLVAYRTDDGGQHWSSRVVRLPAGGR